MNSEINHSGVKGMKWGKHQLQKLKTSNDDYKSKINKIAKSSPFDNNSSDINYAKAVNKSMTKRTLSAAGSAIVGTLINDLFTGKIKSYGDLSKPEVYKKLAKIGKQTVTELVTQEAIARSVANKYNKNGKRVKGTGKALLTREDLAVGAIKVAPTLKKIALANAAYTLSRRQAGEAIFNKWGSRILTDKISDYSKVVPNVNYSVK